MSTPNGHDDTSTLSALQELAVRQEAMLEIFQERIAELETSYGEVDGWLRIAGGDAWDFSRDWLDKLIRLARVMHLKNPLIKRGVNLTAIYTFAQGVTFRAEAADVQAVLSDFWDRRTNQKALFAPEVRMQRSRELDTDGNLFVVLFIDRVMTGRVTVRTLPVNEVRQIITNPQDKQEVWLYERIYTYRDGTHTEQRIDYYPDIDWQPRTKMATYHGQYGTHPILWNSPVVQLKDGGYSDASWGIPTVYAALDWATAVKKDLEDWATVRASLAKFAWKGETAGGSKGVSALKNKLGTTLGSDGTGAVDSNPVGAGSVAAVAKGLTDLNPIRTAGAQPHPDESRRLALMVAAALGWQETMLLGDADQGNLATAKTLDRPAELGAEARRDLWSGLYRRLFDVVIDESVRAPFGLLKGKVITDRLTGEEQVVLAPDPNADPLAEDYDPTAPMSRHVDIDFPTLLERDVAARVGAVKTANDTGKLSPELVARLLLQALEVDDLDEEMVKLFPPDQPEDSGDSAAAGIAAEARFTQVLEAVKAKLEGVPV